MMNWETHFRQLSRPRTTTSFGADAFGSDIVDNLIALNAYFHSTPIKTNEARRLVSDWSRWWIETGNPDNYTFSVPDEVWDEARNRRLAFNMANAVTAAETKQVETVAQTGITSEQSQGLPDRRDPTTGQFFVPPAPVFPSWFWPAVAAGALLYLGVPLLKKTLIPI